MRNIDELEADMMKRRKKDAFHIKLAYLVATQSKDQRTKIGAVVIGPDNEIRSTGYNGLPRGCNDNVPSRQEHPEKYFWFEHAERNAIYNAARMGLSMKGCTMYTQGVPCADCARAIIQAGIIQVVVHKEWNDNNSPKWEESTKRSMEMFNECGVDVEEFSEELPDVIRWQHVEEEGD